MYDIVVQCNEEEETVVTLQMTVRVPADLAEEVDRKASQLRLRRSDIVRMALYAFLEGSPAHENMPSGKTPYERVEHLLGSVDSGIPDLGSRHEEYLREAFDRLMNEAFGANPFKDLGRKSRNGEDLRYNIAVSLSDVAQGTEREIGYRRRVKCDSCGGSGTDGRAARVLCSECGGSGEARRKPLLRRSTRCPKCRGVGKVSATPCGDCGGDGLVPHESRVRVRIPAGVQSGQRLKVRDMGNQGQTGGTTGDLFVVVDVEEHPFFQRDQRHVYCRMPVSFADLALGVDLTVPTLREPATVRVPAGTQPDQVLTLKGHGLPGPRGGRAGDQRVRLVLEIPRDLAPEARETLESARSALDPGPTELRLQVLDLLDEMV